MGSMKARGIAYVYEDAPGQERAGKSASLEDRYIPLEALLQ